MSVARWDEGRGVQGGLVTKVGKQFGVRRIVAVLVAVAASTTAVGAAAPGSTPVAPRQEGPGDERAAGGEARVAIDVDVADGDAEAIVGALDEIQANVTAQLKSLSKAEGVVRERMHRLAQVDAAIDVTEFKIEGLTNASDSVVVTSFVNPPYESAVESMTANSPEGSTVKQAILQMRADRDARRLKTLTSARSKLRREKKHQLKIKGAAQRARQDAEVAVADLKDAFTQRTEFITEVQRWINDPGTAATRAGLTPAQIRHLSDAKAELARKIKESQQALAVAEAKQALAEAAERRRTGGFDCPLRGTFWFRDTYGAPRPGGRTHKGIDLIADTGTPIVAPVSGRTARYHNSTAGNGLYLYGDDGNKYLFAHLSQYVGPDRWAAVGTVIGLVGSGGDASVPHLHFQYHPGGGDPVNPYERLTQVCPNAPH